ncbi:P-loop containing nucleoside triphosphate hydrolase [Pseudocohnilembus persalinus]|uniref:p-loop containing nucleoside triphosphate hydrolase n=1 Tax=Pseudocohnilembus persalinus TaxID=266149 RepID=A0A0V0QBE9_PSEPJ|nr:P-loop containing nucleoside triphosphate hydrolase [Pseudocohnilembus persalinus]|eukprot:KRW99565.1 P-loop containing nucleoside triphosphate hydrolase [Pseudocohnilembus persalinus]
MQVPDYQLPKPVLDTKWVKDQKKLKLSENQQKAIQRVQEINSKHKQKLIEQEQKEKKEYREHMENERKNYLECMRKGRPYTAKVFTKSQQSKQYESKYAQSRIQKLIQERNQLKQKNEQKIKKKQNEFFEFKLENPRSYQKKQMVEKGLIQKNQEQIRKNQIRPQTANNNLKKQDNDQQSKRVILEKYRGKIMEIEKNKMGFKNQKNNKLMAQSMNVIKNTCNNDQFKLCFIEPKLQQKNKEIGFQILNGFGSDIYFGVTSQVKFFKQSNFQLENKSMEDFIKNYKKLEGFYVFGNGKFYSDGGIIADQDFKIEKNAILKINIDFQSKDLKFEKESTGQFFSVSFDKLGQEQIEKFQFFVIVRKINDQVRFIQNIENFKKVRNYQHVKFKKEFVQALNQEKMKKQQALKLFEKQKNNVENKQPEQTIQINEQQKSEDKNKEQKEDEQDPKQSQQSDNKNISQKQKQKQNNQDLKNKYYKELIQQVRSQNEMNENKKEGSDRFGYKITYQFGKEARFKEIKLEDMIKPDSGSYNPLDPKTVRGKLGRDYELDGKAFLNLEMAKGFNNPSGKPSKRTSTKNKLKADKKIKEHHKKLKKEAKKMKALGVIKRKSKSENDVPNLFPYKQQLIEQLQRKKMEDERQKKIKKLQQKEKNEEIKVQEIDAKQFLFQQKLDEEQKAREMADYKNNDIQVSGNKKYYRELNKVCESADIILEVLDARDPDACRNKKLEAQILGMKGDKKIILVLNKIDLVPQGNSEAWLNTLRREYATVLFKANTQQQQSNLSQNTLFKKTLTGNQDLSGDLINSSKAVGAENLLQLIKNYSKVEGVKQAVTVGVIGYPNVGKSSVINSLKRTKACSVSSIAGHTKVLQEIQLDKQVKIIDCPGVVYTDDKQFNLLRNVVKVDDIEDPMEPCDWILKKVPKNDLLLHFKIKDFDNVTKFLVNVALSRGKLGKGGIPDLNAAGKIVLNEWNQGKLKYYTIPPQDDSLLNKQIIQDEQAKEIEME